MSRQSSNVRFSGGEEGRRRERSDRIFEKAYLVADCIEFDLDEESSIRSLVLLASASLRCRQELGYRLPTFSGASPELEPRAGSRAMMWTWPTKPEAAVGFAQGTTEAFSVPNVVAGAESDWLLVEGGFDKRMPAIGDEIGKDPEVGSTPSGSHVSGNAVQGYNRAVDWMLRVGTTLRRLLLAVGPTPFHSKA